MIDFSRNNPYEITIGSKTIKFCSPLVQFIEADNVIVILLEWGDEMKRGYPENAEWVRNIFGFSLSGEQMWQIEGQRNQNNPTSYSGMTVHMDGSLWAFNWNQIRYKVDLRTGKTSDGTYYK